MKTRRELTRRVARGKKILQTKRGKFGNLGEQAVTLRAPEMAGEEARLDVKEGASAVRLARGAGQRDKAGAAQQGWRGA